MTTNYRILRASSALDLTEKVQRAIESGWQPAGGIAVCGTDSAGWEWAQAMVADASEGKQR